MRKQRGITLIALIITIIVLLILAGVSITMISGEDGIINKANNASEKTGMAQKEEESELEEHLQNIDYTVLKWNQNGSVIEKGDNILNVGDIVNYDETKNGEITNIKDVEWKVLGVENGQILLMSTEDIATLTLADKDGYENGVNILNEMCLEYGKGKNAESARSINIEDINKITGYNPKETGNGEIYGKGHTYEYNNKVTYKKVIGNLEYIGENGASGSSWDHNFTYYNGKEWYTLKDGEEVELVNNYYSYYPTTLTANDTDEKNGMLTTDESYKLLFKNIDGTDAKYWLASKFLRTLEGYANYGLRAIDELEVQRCYLITTHESYSGELGVRAVVKLNMNVKFEKNASTNSWDLK